MKEEIDDIKIHSGEGWIKLAKDWCSDVLVLVVLKLKSWFINLHTYAQELNMRLAKFDELDSLIRGMLYVETNNPCECYYWINPTDDERCEKRFFNFSDPYPFLVSQQLLHGSL